MKTGECRKKKNCHLRERTGKARRGGWDVGVLEGSKAAAEGSMASRAAAMAQLKAAGDPARDSRVCGDLYSDMATVTSSAGESKNTVLSIRCVIVCLNLAVSRYSQS